MAVMVIFWWLVMTLVTVLSGTGPAAQAEAPVAKLSGEPWLLAGTGVEAVAVAGVEVGVGVGVGVVVMVVVVVVQRQRRLRNSLFFVRGGSISYF